MSHIFAVHRVMRRSERERHKRAHAGIIGIAARGEVNVPSLDALTLIGMSSEMIVVLFGRTNAQRPGHFDSAAISPVRELVVVLLTHILTF